MHLYAHHKYNGCIIWHLILFESNAYFVSITLHTQQHNMWKDTLPNFCLFLGLTRLLSNSQNFPEGGRGKGGEWPPWQVSCAMQLCLQSVLRESRSFLHFILFQIFVIFSNSAVSQGRQWLSSLRRSWRVSEGDSHGKHTSSHTQI